MLNEYDVGYNTYWLGKPFDPTASTAWQNGWLDAEFEDMDYSGYDNLEDFDFYYGHGEY